jgi:hypothetical protein
MTSGIIMILIMGAMSIVWIGWRMLACPEGYEDHRTLDIPGKIISVIWIVFLLLAILGAVFEN